MSLFVNPNVFADSLGDFYVFNAKMIEAEERVAELGNKDFALNLRKKYNELKTENPQYREYIDKRENTLNWLSTDTQTEHLINRLSEIHGGELIISQSDDGNYEKSRLIALWARSLSLEIEQSKNSEDKAKLPLVYFLQGKADFHFSRLGSDSLKKFLDLSIDNQSKFKKWRIEAKEIMQLLNTNRQGPEKENAVKTHILSN